MSPKRCEGHSFKQTWTNKDDDIASVCDDAVTRRVKRFICRQMADASTEAAPNKATDKTLDSLATSS